MFVLSGLRRRTVRGILLGFLSCLVLVSALHAAEQEAGSDQDPKMPQNVEASNPKSQQRWALFPIIASSPESGQMLGAMLFHFLPVDKPGQQASTIDLLGYGTTKGQYALSLSPNIFLGNGLYRLNSIVTGSFWEANYYAVGNDSPDVSEKYKSTSLLGSIALERRFLDSFVFDLLGLYQQHEMDIKPGGMLTTGNVLGSTDGTYLGLGLETGYDTRDNTNSPTEGIMARYRYVRYDKSIGSDLNFTLQTVDLRYYQKSGLVKDSVLALAANVRHARGDVPFRDLSSPDGTMILRGIENGRYKDKDMVAIQSEFRFPIYGKFSGTIFAEAAQVAPAFGDMAVGDFKPSIGSGFRYALNPDQRFNLRADVSWVDKGIGVIINVREAF